VGLAIMTCQVGRYYVVIDPITSDLYFPFEPWDRMPATCSDRGANQSTCAWYRMDGDRRTRYASAFFETTLLPHGLPGTPTECRGICHCRRYEIKLELFHGDGSLVNWTAEYRSEGRRCTSSSGQNTVTPARLIITESWVGLTLGFRMVLCGQQLLRGRYLCHLWCRLVVDPNCGFIEYTPGASAMISLLATSQQLRYVQFNVWRGIDIGVPGGIHGRQVGDATTPSVGGHLFCLHPSLIRRMWRSARCSPRTPGGMDPRDRAAFAETLYVNAMATDGWAS
jgi:hypothetical protein